MSEIMAKRARWAFEVAAMPCVRGFAYKRDIPTIDRSLPEMSTMKKNEFRLRELQPDWDVVIHQIAQLKILIP